MKRIFLIICVLFFSAPLQAEGLLPAPVLLERADSSTKAGFYFRVDFSEVDYYQVSYCQTLDSFCEESIETRHFTDTDINFRPEDHFFNYQEWYLLEVRSVVGSSKSLPLYIQFQHLDPDYTLHSASLGGVRSAGVNKYLVSNVMNPVIEIRTDSAIATLNFKLDNQHKTLAAQANQEVETDILTFPLFEVFPELVEATTKKVILQISAKDNSNYPMLSSVPEITIMLDNIPPQIIAVGPAG